MEKKLELENGSIILKKEGKNQTLMFVGAPTQKEFLTGILTLINMLDDRHRFALKNIINSSTDEELVEELNKGIIDRNEEMINRN